MPKLKARQARIAGRLVKVTDAKKSVTVQRTLFDIWTGKRGRDASCMNAQCVMRNKAAFPHKVIAVSIIASRVYVFDKPDHVWRYTLNNAQRQGIHAHDRVGIARPETVTFAAPGPARRLGPTKPRKKVENPRPDSVQVGRRSPVKHYTRAKARHLASVGAF